MPARPVPLSILKRSPKPGMLAATAALTVPFILACNDTVSPASRGLTASAASLSPTLDFDRSHSPFPVMPGLDRLKHIVVIYLENHSFDNLYGEFPGADGLDSPRALGSPKQIDATGTPYATLAGAYMHNGVFRTLHDVVDFYNRGGGAGVGADVPNATLSPTPLHLSAPDQRDIIAFLGALVDTAGLTQRPSRLPRFEHSKRLTDRPIGGRY